MGVLLGLLIIQKALCTRCFEKNLNEMLGIANVELDKVDTVDSLKT